MELDNDLFSEGWMSDEEIAAKKAREVDEQRGTILPFRKDEEGLHWAMPQWMIDAKNALTLPRDTLEGYEPTHEDIINFGLTVGVGGVTGSAAGMVPEGAIGTFSGGKPKHITPLYQETPQYPFKTTTDIPQAYSGRTPIDPDDFIIDEETGSVLDFNDLSVGELTPIPEGSVVPEDLELVDELFNYFQKNVQEAKEDEDFLDDDIQDLWNYSLKTFTESFDVSKGDLNTQFQSPVRDAIDHMDFPTKGVNIIRDLEKNAPSIRKSELDTYPLDKIDPNKKYTKEEADELLAPYWKVEANERHEYSSYQRQTVADEEIEYKEFPIDGMAEGKEFKANNQHFGQNTLAHTRVSLRQGEEVFEDPTKMTDDEWITHNNGDDVKRPTEPYVLIEELQSDLVQGGWKEGANPDMDKWLTKLDGVENYTAYEDIDPTALYHYGIEDSKAYAKDFYQYRFLQTVADRIEAQPSNYNLDATSKIKGSLARAREKLNLYRMEDGKYRELRKDPDYVHLRNRMISLADEDAYIAIQELTAGGGKPPIKSTQEGVRLGILQAISYAQQKGVDKVVIPPLDRILQVRHAQEDPEWFHKNMKPGSGFYDTYVRSVNKVLNSMVNELGGKLKVGPREMKYNDVPKPKREQMENPDQFAQVPLEWDEATGQWVEGPPQVAPHQQQLVQDVPGRGAANVHFGETAVNAFIDADHNIDAFMEAAGQGGANFGYDGLNWDDLRDMYDGIMNTLREGNTTPDPPKKVNFPTYTNLGIEIDISGLGKLNASKPRFAEGGLVSPIERRNHG
jgi:hypothetical protein